MINALPLASKTCLVTGGATGIGLAIAQALARQGAKTAIAGRRAEKLLEASEASRPLELLSQSVDVADRASVERLFAWTAEYLGPIDILINSAGANIRNRSMAQMRPEQWDQLLAINATGAYNCMYCALPDMRRRKDGLIVNISSISGRRAYALGGVAYCASKFAMAALGTAVANEDNVHGVRVTNVYPGEVDTPILEHRPQVVSAEHRARILQPQDVADLVVAVALLPPRAHVPELIVKPSFQEFV